MLRLAQHDNVVYFVALTKPAFCYPEQREGSNPAGLVACPRVLTYKVPMLRLGSSGSHYTSDLMIQTLPKPRTSTL